MVRTNQGGSVLSFVLVGIVAIALLVGGVYIIRQQSAQPTEMPTPATTDKPQQTKKPASSDNQASNKQDTASKPPQQAAPPPANSVPADKLPQTGPGETFGSMVVIGLVCAVVVTYLRSRRPELSL